MADVLYQLMGVDHEDDRRELFSAFNGDLGDFVARQVKFLKLRKDAQLGGHYHDYRELFYLLEGSASFQIIDINSKEETIIEMVPKSRILLPPYMAHRISVEGGSILVGCTEKEYVSPQVNDFPYDFDARIR